MARKGKGSDRENRGTSGKPKRNGEEHSKSNPGRTSGSRTGGRSNG